MNKKHVIPLNDSREHAVSGECPCHPLHVDGIYVHHAWDVREAMERRGLVRDSRPWGVFVEGES